MSEYQVKKLKLFNKISCTEYNVCRGEKLYNITGDKKNHNLVIRQYTFNIIIKVI